MSVVSVVAFVFSLIPSVNHISSKVSFVHNLDLVVVVQGGAQLWQEAAMTTQLKPHHPISNVGLHVSLHHYTQYIHFYSTYGNQQSRRFLSIASYNMSLYVYAWLMVFAAHSENKKLLSLLLFTEYIVIFA